MIWFRLKSGRSLISGDYYIKTRIMKFIIFTSPLFMAALFSHANSVGLTTELTTELATELTTQ